MNADRSTVRSLLLGQARRAGRVLYGVIWKTVGTGRGESPARPPVVIVQTPPLPELGYDAETIHWAEGLLRGDPRHPYPAADPTESLADASRLRGVFPYLCKIHSSVSFDVLQERTQLLLAYAQNIRRDALWDPTNSALRLVALLEGLSALPLHLRSELAASIPMRFLSAHRLPLLVGRLVEPAGNHRIVSAAGRIALDALLPTPHAKGETGDLAAATAAQFLDDGGHVERCPQYHLQVLDLLRVIRSSGVAPATSNHALSLQAPEAALGGMLLGGRPAPLGDVSRLWSGLREEIATSRASNARPSSHAHLRSFGLARRQWKLANGADAELVVRLGSFEFRHNIGHAHDDSLSYCLRSGPHVLVTDPGVRFYAAHADDVWFKTRGAHSTVFHPPSVARPRGFYRWPREVLQDEVRIEESAPQRIAAVVRRGDNAAIPSHGRRWRLGQTGVTVEDHLHRTSLPGTTSRLVLGPGCQAEQGRGGLVVHNRGSAVAHISWRSSRPADVTVVPSLIAPTYGHVLDGEALEWKLTSAAPDWSLALDIRLAGN